MYVHAKARSICIRVYRAFWETKIRGNSPRRRHRALADIMPALFNSSNWSAARGYWFVVWDTWGGDNAGLLAPYSAVQLFGFRTRQLAQGWLHGFFMYSVPWWERGRLSLILPIPHTRPGLQTDLCFSHLAQTFPRWLGLQCYKWKPWMRLPDYFFYFLYATLTAGTSWADLNSNRACGKGLWWTCGRRNMRSRETWGASSLGFPRCKSGGGSGWYTILPPPLPPRRRPRWICIDNSSRAHSPPSCTTNSMRDLPCICAYKATGYEKENIFGK